MRLPHLLRSEARVAIYLSKLIKQCELCAVNLPARPSQACLTRFWRRPSSAELLSLDIITLDVWLQPLLLMLHVHVHVRSQSLRALRRCS